MKTAISLPDTIFRDADALAKKLGVSRSQLYATAVAEYLARRNGEQVKARLDQVYGANDGRPDPALAALTARPAAREDSW
jgi:predicted transcriptional regulator